MVDVAFHSLELLFLTISLWESRFIAAVGNTRSLPEPQGAHATFNVCIDRVVRMLIPWENVLLFVGQTTDDLRESFLLPVKLLLLEKIKSFSLVWLISFINVGQNQFISKRKQI